MEIPINGPRASGLTLAMAGMAVLVFSHGVSKLAPNQLTGNALSTAMARKSGTDHALCSLTGTAY